MSKPIVVFGAGGHAKAMIEVIEKQGLYEITGLLDANKSIGETIYGYKVLGDDSWLEKHSTSIYGAIVGIGDNWTRGVIVRKLLKAIPNLTFCTAIHPSAQIARGVCIGAGSVIMANAVVNSDAVIGEHTILYPGVSVDHDSNIGSFVSFAPKAATGGDVRVGHYSAISIGATLIHGITIGEHSVIGAGSTVLSNIPSYTVAFGTPAKPIRSRKQGERYL